jgi:hypothetical protein
VGSGTSIDVDADTLLRHTKVAFMGSLEARKGRFGAFTDVMYFDIGGSRTGTGSLAVSGIQLPPGIEARATLDIKTTVWMLAAEYEALSTPDVSVDVFAGARTLEARTNVGYEFDHEFGPFVGPARQGSAETKLTNWDAIVGAKGRVNFGADRKWFVPYYVDVGAGDSDSTWQAMAGIGYTFGRTEVIAAWRHLDYRFKSGTTLQSLTFDGPAVGVAVRW